MLEDGEMSRPEGSQNGRHLRVILMVAAYMHVAQYPPIVQGRSGDRCIQHATP